MGVYIEGTNKPETDGTMYQISYFTRDGYFITESYPIYRVIDLDLVRCGECKHYGFKDTDRGGFPCCTNVIGATPYRMPTDFCSYGERRDDDNTIKANK